MKTIEEKALEKAEKYYAEDRELRNLDSFYDGYIQGAAKALRSQWRSVVDELPEDQNTVLVVCEYGYCLGYYDKVWEMWFINGFGQVESVVAWLPIPKYEAKGGEQ